MTRSRNKESPLSFIGIILALFGLAILLVCVWGTVSPIWVDPGGAMDFFSEEAGVFFCIAPIGMIGLILILGGYALTSFQLAKLRSLFLVFSMLAFLIIAFHWTTAPPEDPPMDALVDETGYYVKAPEAFFVAAACLAGVFGAIGIGSYVLSFDWMFVV